MAGAGTAPRGQARVHAHVTTPATRALAPLTVRKSVGTVTNTVPNPLAPLTVPEWRQGDPLAGSPTRKAPLSSQRWCSPASPLGRPRTGGASRAVVPNHLDPPAHWGAAEPIRGMSDCAGRGWEAVRCVAAPASPGRRRRLPRRQAG